MILSDVAIHQAIDEGRIVIDPEPLPRIVTLDNPNRPYDRTAVDLHLGSTLQITKADLAIMIDFRDGSVMSTIDALYEPVTIPATGYPLEPKQFVLGITRKRIRLPLPSEFPAPVERPCLAARVEGKSSRARFGLLIHFTAPTIHAGFEGTIALEIMNLGPRRFFSRLGSPSAN